MRSTVHTRLDSLGVAITRPLPQGRHLGETITEAGGRVIEFPTLEVRGTADDSRWIERLRQAGAVDWYIFISVNAVDFGVPLIGPAGVDMEMTKVASMGPATSEALGRHRIRVDLECPAPVSSESLLSCPRLRQKENQRVIIFRGQGGREHLRRGLEKLGATVEYIECYQRRCPNTNTVILELARVENRLDVIVTTSVDGLSNLMELIRQAGHAKLLETDLVVAGERQAEEARSRGWRGRVFAADDASDAAIVRRLGDSFRI